MYKKVKKRFYAVMLTVLMAFAALEEPFALLAVRAGGEETEVRAETEAVRKGLGFYAGYWIGSLWEDGSGGASDIWNGAPVSEARQMELYADGTGVMLRDGSVDSGYWSETDAGICVEMYTAAGAAYRLEAVSADEALMLKDGPGSFRMVRAAGAISWSAGAEPEADIQAESEAEMTENIPAQTESESEVIGESKGQLETEIETAPETAAWCADEAEPEAETACITESEMLSESESEHVEMETAFETWYESEGETEGETIPETEFEISSESESETEARLEDEISLETEMEMYAESENETDFESESEILEETEADFESESEIREETEVDFESEAAFRGGAETDFESEAEILKETEESEAEILEGAEADFERETADGRETEMQTERETETEAAPENAAPSIGNLHEARKKSRIGQKTFRVATKGGTLQVFDKNQQLLATLAYGDDDLVLKVSEDTPDLEDVTVIAQADPGYLVHSYLATAVDHGVSIITSSESAINQATYSRGHYLNQTDNDEQFEVAFAKEGTKSRLRAAAAAASVGDIDNPEVGDTFSGNATLTYINSPAGKAYNGTGVITCTSGDFDGDSFAMGGCASGHDFAIPLQGSTGTYTLTITAVDKANGKVSYYIRWYNSMNPSGYQDLYSYGSYDHSFTARIKATKTAKDGFDASVSSEYSLKGAEFTLYENYDAATGTVSGPLGVMITGSSGKTTVATAITVTAGKTYYVKETKAPKGFLINETVYPVTAAEATNVVTVTNEAKKGMIRIKKVDAATGKVDPSLAGAKFRIYKDADCTDSVQTLTVDETGYAQSASYYILGKTYYVKEISAPEGWEPDDEIKEVVIEDDGSDVPRKTITFRDEKETGGIAVQKYDKKTGKAEPLSEAYSFKGAIYTIYRDKECTDRVGSITTDETGYGKKEGLENGTYYVKETRVPTNGHYELDETIYTAEINSTKTVKIKSKEEPTPTHLKILKVNEKTGKADPDLEGTTFGVFSDAACTKKLESVVIGEDGVGLTSDSYYYDITYYVKETKAKPGWILNTTVYPVTPTETVKVPAVTVENTPQRGSISVQKINQNADYVARYSLKGAMYTIYTDEACTDKAGSMTTDETGYGEKTGLKLGTYYVKETRVPTSGGYEMDQTVYTVKITAQNYSETIAITSNEPIPYGSILVEKHDSETDSSTPANGYYSMDGAVYGLYLDVNCTQLKETRTIANGTATFEKLEYNTYYVREITPPVGGAYDLDPKVYEAVVNGPSIKIISTDPVRKGQLQILKYDKATGTAAALNEHYTLDGAVYTIYSDAGCTQAVKSLITENGRAQTGRGELLFGNYWVKETKAPAGYQTDATIYPVTINSSNYQETILVCSFDQPKYGAISIEKHDAETGTTTPVNGKYTLDGAVYTIFSNENCTEKVQDLTIKNGRAQTAFCLPFGNYWVKETKAPADYEMDKTVYPVTIDALNCAAPIQVVSEDTPKRGAIAIEKRDGVTGTTTPVNEFYVLDGAVYTIYRDQNCTEKVQELTIAGGKAQTDRTLLFGTYYVKETRVPEGYELDERVYPVTIDHTNCETPVLVTSVDLPKRGSIAIEKHDAETGSTDSVNGNYSMDGAVYTVYTDQALRKPAGTITISNGRGQLENLLFGIYYIKETAPPPYYQADETVFCVTIDSKNYAQAVQILSTDIPKRAKLSVQKIDAETGGKPITAALNFEGAVFGIYRDSTCTELAERLVTDADGYAVSGDLLIGTYYIQEITPPTGYNRNPNVFLVTPDKMKQAIDQKNEAAVVETVVAESVIRANVLLMKYINDDDGSTIQRPEGADLENIRFTFTYLADPSVSFDVCGEKNTIITDKNGVATTENRTKYPRGTLLYGKWSITEIPNSGLLEPIVDFEIEVTEEGVCYPYVANNDTVQARIEIQKQDADTGNRIPLSGVTFQVKDETGREMEMWDSASGTYTSTFATDEKGTVRLPNTLFYGQYTLVELTAPTGYLLSEPMTFRVEQAYRNPLEPLIVVCEDAPQMGRIELEKLDADTGARAGAGFRYEVTAAADIVDAAGMVRTGEDVHGNLVPLVKGTVVDSILTDEEGQAVSKALYLGSYVLTETEAAEYYAVDVTEIPVELTADQEQDTACVEVTAKDRKTYMELCKLDAYDTLRFLPGVSFRIFTEEEIKEDRIKAYNEKLQEIQKEQTEEGENLSDVSRKELEEILKVDFTKIGREYTTDTEGFLRIEELKHDTMYYLIESKTLPGYNLDPTIYAIYVDQDGLIEKEPGHRLTLSNVPNVLQISKVTVTGTQELPGAQLTLTDSEGKEVDSWISGTEPHLLKGLEAGDYTLTEIAAPEGFAKAESITFTVTDTLEVQTVTMEDEPISVEFQKLDASTGETVKGARLVIRDTEGTVIEEWTTTGEPHQITMNAGDYTLEEAEAPDGFATAEQIPFTVTDSRGVQSIILENTPLKLVISKKTESGEMVPGAILQLTDEEGRVVETWVSETQPHVISYLKKGVYTLKELSAPEGYSVAEDVRFRLIDTAKVQYVNLTNTLTEVAISKTDITGETELPGAELILKDSDGKVIEKWISTEEPHRIRGLAAGEYTLTEQTAPTGYAKAETISFTVTDSREIQRVVMKDAQIKVVISKKDLTTKQELPGAELIITDSAGKEVERWISGEMPHVIEGLAAGDYILTEITAPEGYTKAESVRFTITDAMEPQLVEMFDEPTRVEISKTDITDGKELPGARLTITDAAGTVVREWVSTEEPTVITGLPAGDYILTEILAPEGYATAESAAFTITDAREISKVEMQDAPTIVEISKKEITGGKPLEGAVLAIIDSKGAVVETWTSTKKPHRITKLPVGTYVLREMTAPEGYRKTENVTFEVFDTEEIQTITMYDYETKVQISKTDQTTGKELSGAKLSVKNSAGKVVETWISEEEPHILEGLPAGMYTLTELAAPDGYACAGTVSFQVTDEDQVLSVTMADAPIQVEILKKDQKTSKMIEGARMALKDSEGRIIEEWTTDGTAHKIEKLPIGTYVLTEKQAPKGYQLAEDISFIVRNTGDVQRFTMYDSPEEETEEETPSTETEPQSETTPSTETEPQSETTPSTETEPQSEITPPTETEPPSETTPPASATPSTGDLPAKTGDNTVVVPYIFLCAGALLTCLYLLGRKRRMVRKP
ncbi:MAG: SpaA isopeptide-forming pilin-related protein [Eubacteriales bacterium]|nr:SpaA isopeptide-forming pilin-related protein [Eubacteriales bacterium]